jgi:hypothetical protein
LKPLILLVFMLKSARYNFAISPLRNSELEFRHFAIAKFRAGISPLRNSELEFRHCETQDWAFRLG